MALNEKEKRRLVALVKGLKTQKGITLNQNSANKGIQELKGIQKEILQVKKEYPDSAEVKDKADKEFNRLQNIIDNLNEYMTVLHPEGLIDLGSGSGGGKVMGQG